MEMSEAAQREADGYSGRKRHRERQMVCLAGSCRSGGKRAMKEMEVSRK